MTLEIIVFIASILFGIVIYWRESKNNSLYRFFNKLAHSEELQMKPESRKGFVHQQVFLMRLVWIALLFLISAIVVGFVTPVMILIQYFASAIVGSLIGTYIASAFLFAKDSASKENLTKVFEKGKDMVEDLSEDIKETFEKETIDEENSIEETEEAPQKSARDRLKDKGMIN